ncbi:MAG TPA: class I SAM-dependent RNA methyltransferase [Candidatus Corynebacterium avicola]|uniref:Class I SAM-dependent RNA methyltransferase n=1 Tax=Candidatus Corynebacterium avicola TaxID=2838527 RepID=A0A9D1UL78_9CORY|nr:class I SAM-dependent RNA methyltransferase [Candidatus Corynebacterium avicola]
MLGPAHGGSTVARLDGEDGRVVFVRGALPGETGVPVELDTDPETSRKRFLTGAVTDPAAITGPSAHRVGPQCPTAVLGAGCCDLDVIDAEGSAELKTRVVLDQFTRIGHIDLTGSGVPVHQLSPAPFTGYRTRVRLGVDDHGQAGIRRRGSNGIVPVSEATCAQWAPEVADGLAEVLAEAELTPGSEICVAVGEDGLRGIVEVPAARPANPRSRSNRRRCAPKSKRQVVQRRVIEHQGSSEPGTVTRTVDGVSWPMPVEAFWQAHGAAAELYAGWVRDTVAGVPGPTSAWDLYGGAGVFAAALTEALPGTSVYSVDGASDATAAGRTVLADRDVHFVTGDVAKALGDLADADPGVVVLDPPRTGAGAPVVEAIVARAPQHVLHIGCDPATAARDAAGVIAGGYRPESVTVVDAFGLTHHVEVLVHYTRQAAGDDGEPVTP